MGNILRTERAQVLWALEASYGDGGSGSWDRFGLHDDITLPDPTFDWDPEWEIFKYPAPRSRAYVFLGQARYQGALTDVIVVPGSESFLHLILGAARDPGSPTPTFGEGRTDTLDELMSFGLWVQVTDVQGGGFRRLYRGGKCANGRLWAEEGGYLHTGMEMMFKDMIHNAGGQQSFPLGPVVDPGPRGTGRYVFSEAQLVAAGIPICRVKGFELRVEHNLEPLYDLYAPASSEWWQARTLTTLCEGPRVYTLNVDLDMADPDSDLDLWTYYMNQGRKAGQTEPLGAQVIIAFDKHGGLEGVNRKMTIKCTLDDWATNFRAHGTVIKQIMNNIPAASYGYPTATVLADVDRVNVVFS